MNLYPGQLSSNKKTLSVYDFDGTISHKDTFVPFLKFAFGKKVFLLNMYALICPSVKYLAGKISRDHLKHLLVQQFLTGVNKKWLDKKARDFCNHSWETIINKDAVAQINNNKSNNFKVTICSASPSFLLTHFAKRLGVELISTELETKKGFYTGRIIGGNCRARNKVTKLTEKYKNLSTWHVIAWGDSPGDYDLLHFANVAFWRPFRSRASTPPNYEHKIKKRKEF